ncbi:YitT family protein [Tunicatimonas pelagia]|uniref:YitT family protein n=1 Tax=Tunicatimonas pelagia TaxID=931531 RepID=UPI0026660242|nr:YitT family protein [Tunicatimonas pelagia]WKN42625.1 YitT family protein [Tunicatimonas pelagia]
MNRAFLIRRRIIEFLLIGLGIAFASIGLKGFLLPNHFLDGGVTGVSLLVNHVTDWNIAWLIVVINAPFIWLGYRQISSILAFKSIISILIFAVALFLIEVPLMTEDKLLIAIFGGIFLGAGIGFSVRGGAVIDGTEILAIYLGKKFRTTIGSVILVFNIVLFIIAAMVIDVEVALYSILTYLVASRTTDYIIHGIEEYIGVTIISPKSEEIREAITEAMGYGLTIYQGKRGYKKMPHLTAEIDIIHTIVTRLDLRRLHNVVENIDPQAFVVEYNVNDTKGGVIKKKLE